MRYPQYQAGDEITYDYNLFDGEGDAPCYCGSKRCRGTLYSREEIRRRQREAKKKRLLTKKKSRAVSQALIEREKDLIALSSLSKTSKTVSNLVICSRSSMRS